MRINPFKKREVPAPTEIKREELPEQKINSVPEREAPTKSFESTMEKQPTLMGYRWKLRFERAGLIPKGEIYDSEELQKQMTAKKAKSFFLGVSPSGREKLKSDYLEETPEHTAKRLSERKNAANPTIENSRSIEDLYDALDFMGEIRGSENVYPAKNQKEEISILMRSVNGGLFKSEQEVRDSKLLNRITRTEGLRAKALELAVKLYLENQGRTTSI